MGLRNIAQKGANDVVTEAKSVALEFFQIFGWIMHRFGQWLDMMMDVGFLCSFLMFF